MFKMKKYVAFLIFTGIVATVTAWVTGCTNLVSVNDLLDDIDTANVSNLPVITVKQGGTDIKSGTGQYDFGAVTHDGPGNYYISGDVEFTITERSIKTRRI